MSVKGLKCPQSMRNNIVKENMEFEKYPLSGHYTIVMFMGPIMSRVTHPGKCLSPKIRLFAITFFKKYIICTRQKVSTFSSHL